MQEQKFKQKLCAFHTEEPMCEMLHNTAVGRFFSLWPFKQKNRYFILQK